MLHSIISAISAIGGLVGIVGVIYGIVQGRRALQQQELATSEYQKALDISEQLRRLVQEYRGRILSWESLIETLADEVSKESACIQLALDTLEYGSISAPEHHKKFWAALLQKAAVGTTIHIVTFDEQAQIQMLQEQFSSDTAPVPGISEGHFAKVDTLYSEGGDSVEILLGGYFPLHLFLFEAQKKAIFALLELTGDAKVRAFAFETTDPVLMEVCNKSFEKMRRVYAHSISQGSKRKSG